MNQTLPTADHTMAADVVASLRKTFATGVTRDIPWRESQLDAVIRFCEEQEDAIADALASDQRRRRDDVWLADVGGIVMEARHARKHLRTWVRPSRRLLPSWTLPALGRLVTEPLGVVLVIGPWNFPIYLTLAPMVGVLAAGNCAVIKPSEHAPACSRLLADTLPQYLDSDAIKVVEGAAETTQALISAGVDHIFFTGGSEVGKHILTAAAPTLTPVTLELGGKSPVIVAADADLPVAARRIAWAKLTNSGQVCITADYILVDRSVRDEFLAQLTKTYEEFLRGYGVTGGQPVINQRQLTRLTSLLEDHGGTVVRGGGVDTAACTMEPTIILDPSRSAPVMQEEIFGPILPVLSIDSAEEAFDFIIGGHKPLGAYLFSNDSTTIEQFEKRVSAGGLVINQIGLHCLTPQMPFGGVGYSGMGSYHGRWGFETFSHRKPVIRKWTRPDPPLMYPPVRDWKQRLVRKMM